jgi:hypothetical protein
MIFRLSSGTALAFTRSVAALDPPAASVNLEETTCAAFFPQPH